MPTNYSFMHGAMRLEEVSCCRACIKPHVFEQRKEPVDTPRMVTTPGFDHFADWMHEIDLLCIERFGVSIHDLPDRPFRDAFEAGSSPEEFMAEEENDFRAMLA